MIFVTDWLTTEEKSVQPEQHLIVKGAALRIYVRRESDRTGILLVLTNILM